MKIYFKNVLLLLTGILVFSLHNSCEETTKANTPEIAFSTEIKTHVHANNKKELSSAFKKYWYAGKAEITSYKLEQGRYGQLREGHAVLIYVTEPFLAGKQVKADRDNPGNIPVLKLNATKNYLTGIYPYSIMSSTFYPVHDDQHALKISTSVQEWCGHVYSQLNNREQFEIISHSYFEKEADQEITLDKAVLENEIWNKIRINPENLPQGEIQMIPSLEYIRVGHKSIASYKAMATLENNGELSIYQIVYPDLERTLEITFSSTFPYTIESWEDSFKSGFGAKAQTLTSKGTRIKQLNIPYWRKNANKDVILRDSLGI